ncbi:MAG: AbrB/MazE/SpoVT family DNA-binding domain-containing protein [Candidatus Woesearchaeota archaeon]
MQRKIIKQGINGYTIYLPKNWVENKGLKEGDSINIKETGTSLIIGSPNVQKKETTIKLTEDNNQDIKNILTHLYRNGFSIIRFENTNEKTSEDIRTITNDLLLGFENTEKTQSKYTIENLSEPTEERYDVMLRRVFLIIKETLKIIIEDFEKNKFQRMKEIQELRDQQFKFILFCRRILIKEKYEKLPVLGWELLTFLTHIQHSMYYLYEYAQKNQKTKDKEIIELLHSLEEFFELYYDAYYQKKIKNIHKINDLKKDYAFGKCIKYLEKSTGARAVILSYIKEQFRLIQVATSPILSELLDTEYKETISD